MTIAEKFITIWLDGDNEKAVSMIENNDWIEITAKRLEEILYVFINREDGFFICPACETTFRYHWLTCPQCGKARVISSEHKIVESEAEIQLNKYKIFFEKIVAILNDDPETDVFARGVICAVRETYEEINQNQPQSIQYDIDICKHGKGHCQCDNTRCRNYCD